MTTVYTVATGSYSDYRIVAAFSSEEKAENFCRWNNPKQEDGHDAKAVDGHGKEFTYSPDYCIEAWDLDTNEVTIPAGYLPYRVALSKTGDVSTVTSASYDDVEMNSGKINFLAPLREGRNYFVPGWCVDMASAEFMITHVLARSKRHAVKIAAERRAQILALNL